VAVHEITVADTARGLGVPERSVWRRVRAGRGWRLVESNEPEASSGTELQEARREVERLTQALAAAQRERNQLLLRVVRLRRTAGPSGPSPLDRLADLLLFSVAAGHDPSVDPETGASA